MENKIKNPVSKKNIFFFNIFDRLINSIEKYVHKTEEDTFAENFDILKEDSMISVMPKGSTVEKLGLGNEYTEFKVNTTNFDGSVTISGDDKFIYLLAQDKTTNDYADFTLNTDGVNIDYYENNIKQGQLMFTKDTITMISSNNVTYNIGENQLNTLIHAATYSVNEVDYLIDLFSNTGSDKRKVINMGDDASIIFMDNNMFELMSYNSLYLYMNNDGYKQTKIELDKLDSSPNIIITRKNDSGETNADQVLKFADETNNLEVTFTVAELVALKALLPTT